MASVMKTLVPETRPGMSSAAVSATAMLPAVSARKLAKLLAPWRLMSPPTLKAVKVGTLIRPPPDSLMPAPVKLKTVPMSMAVPMFRMALSSR